jgi:hypothetical protein
MPLRKSHPRPRLFVVAGAAALALAVPGAASAASASQNLTCTAQAVASPFSIFGDLTSYWLAPGGSFETGAAGWKLDGAKVVTGNEPWGIVKGTKSLQFSGDATIDSATTPEFCVDPTHPTFRFLVKNAAAVGVLNTWINFKAASGVTLKVPAKVNSFTFGAWTLSASQPLASKIPDVFLGTGTTASITFQAQTTTAKEGLRIDDLMIDPYRRG